MKAVLTETRIDFRAMRDWLLATIRARASDSGARWLDKAVQAIESGAIRTDTMLSYYTGASRWLGKSALQLDDAERARLNELAPRLPMDHWGLDEAARAAILLSIAHLPNDEFRLLALQAYELGDSREQQSWLRGLFLLPGRERFRNTAIDACRTNILPLFESIACENPYPLFHFPESNFNHMVLKNLFMGVAIARIVGLEERLNADLSRMANDYLREREAAGRPVPTDIWLVLASHAEPEALESLYRYFGDPDPKHRYHAAIGLGLRGDPAQRARLEHLRSTERDANVIRAVEASLNRIAGRERSAAP